MADSLTGSGASSHASTKKNGAPLVAALKQRLPDQAHRVRRRPRPAMNLRPGVADEREGERQDKLRLGLPSSSTDRRSDSNALRI